MRFSNFYGYSLMMAPYSVPKNNTPHGSLLSGGDAVNNTDFTTSGNEIIFFNNTMPSSEELYSFTTKEGLLEAHGTNKICTVSDIDISWTWDNTEYIRKRTIRKVPVDALDMTAQIDGDIVWAAIICAQSSSSDQLSYDATKNNILYTDTIGGWNNDTKAITVNKTTGHVQGDTVIFKDMSFELLDRSPLEGGV